MAVMAPASYALVPKEYYHVMWVNNKGKSKCCCKGSKEKADQLAEKIRTEARGTGVEVMAGKCSRN